VLILGSGPIGFSCLEVVKVAGAAKVIVSEPQQHRREVAEALGADKAVDPLHEDVVETVSELTDGRLCDCVIEASGDAAGIATAVEVVRRGGRVSFVGMGNPGAGIPHAQVLKKEAMIQGVYRYANAYPPVLSLLAAGKLDSTRWISHRLPLTRIQEAMEMSADPSVRKLKMIITTAGNGA
jgi:L-iditol 2-dehydrogenase